MKTKFGREISVGDVIYLDDIQAIVLEQPTPLNGRDGSQWQFISVSGMPTTVALSAKTCSGDLLLHPGAPYKVADKS